VDLDHLVVAFLVAFLAADLED
jgi:hypothetical protein